MTAVSVTLIGKTGCHLCADARAVIETVRADLASRGIATELEELDILDDTELAKRHSEDVPVVRIEGRRHAIWRVDPERLTAAIERASAKRVAKQAPRSKNPFRLTRRAS
ncbi:glutaredoxin family protein [Leucobacter sp. GX24907]